MTLKFINCDRSRIPMNHLKKISIVIPAYNEAPNIFKLHQALTETLANTPYLIEYIFIDDGSNDDTALAIENLCQTHPNVFFIQLSRNFGHQNALKAGLDYANGDCVVSMDCDLQHPPKIILELIKKWEEGYEVVYTRRKDNTNVSFHKRHTSSLFYYIHNQLSDFKLEKGTADFRLMNRNVVMAFQQIQESELFIRGLVIWAGFKQIAVEYESDERHSGKSKYSYKQMISFAGKGLTSFSTKPLKLIVYAGLISFFLSLILVPYAFISYLMGNAVSGWTSIMISIFAFGSLQLLMTGIIGLYVGKIVIQSKNRPHYFIRKSNYHYDKYNKREDRASNI
jgi:polyisoprenyl-phosphate glycosyltransferase